MKFQYVCKEVSLTPAMRKACEEKLAKFERYFRSEGEVSCVVTILIRPNKIKSVEVAMSTVDGFYLRAQAKERDFYNAVDTVVEKLEGQMRKIKTQINKSTKHNSLSENIYLDQIVADEAEENEFEIVRRKSLSLTPMDEEEALARMDALGHHFFIYLDSATGLVNVIYEREDHGYGVIEIEK
ncbi:MAG: ribosome-associated translation inhibitor RaiA [Bacilli bacterium]|jgi:putative sigma-54 modulation protein|nr:ribosome-associated translation inhibitor RaiA [Bacilli bacterium]